VRRRDGAVEARYHFYLRLYTRFEFASDFFSRVHACLGIDIRTNGSHAHTRHAMAGITRFCFSHRYGMEQYSKYVFFTTDSATVAAQTPSWCGSSANLTLTPMGASIVWGHSSSDGNGFRLGLYNLLNKQGMQTTMTGMQYSGAMSENHHEAYQGKTIDEYNDVSYHSGVYDLNPNVILILVGTNDCWWIQSDKTDNPRFQSGVEAAERFRNLLGSVRERAPDALVMASQLSRNTVEWCDECIRGFNSRLPDVVADAAAQGQTVKMVGMYDAVPAEHIGPDGTHPTDYGYQLMAQEWYSSIVSAKKELCAELAEDQASTSSSTSSRASTSSASSTTSSKASSTTSATSSSASSTASTSSSESSTASPTASSQASSTASSISSSTASATSAATTTTTSPTVSDGNEQAAVAETSVTASAAGTVTSRQALWVLVPLALWALGA